MRKSLVLIAILELSLLSALAWRLEQRKQMRRDIPIPCRHFVFSDQFSTSVTQLSCVLRLLTGVIIEPIGYREIDVPMGKFIVTSSSRTDESVADPTKIIFTPGLSNRALPRRYVAVFLLDGSNVQKMNEMLKRISEFKEQTPQLKQGLLILTKTSEGTANAENLTELSLVNEDDQSRIQSMLKSIEQGFPALRAFKVFFMGDPCVQNPLNWKSDLQAFIQSISEELC